MENFDYFLIVDLEATCCDQESIPKEEMETIEIGAVLVEAKELKIVDTFTTFIKPVRHPTLTPFCTQLTTIAQQDVDQALSYPEAIQAFKEWLAPYHNYVFCSWGDYDKYQLEQDSQFHEIPFPIDAPHVNIKILFSTSQKRKKRYGLAKALRLTGLELEGQHHRGLDDAKNMARLMPYVLGYKSLICQ